MRTIWPDILARWGTRPIALLEPNTAVEAATVLVAALNNLGQMYKTQGRNAESVAVLERALDANAAILGVEDGFAEQIQNTLDELRVSSL